MENIMIQTYICSFLQVRVFSGHRGAPLALAFSPDGLRLAAAGEDRRIRVYDLASAALAADFRGGHTAPIAALAWSPDSQLLTSAASDGVVRHWRPLEATPSSDQQQHQQMNMACDGGVAGQQQQGPAVDLDNGGASGSDVLHTGCCSLFNLKYTPQNTLLVVGQQLQQKQRQQQKQHQKQQQQLKTVMSVKIAPPETM